MDRFPILAVCTANICRSPIIEQLLRARLDPSRYETASAGLFGWAHEPMDSMAAMESLRLGYDPLAFRSQPINRELVERAGLILTAAREHRAGVLDLSPGMLPKTFTLIEFAGLVAEIEASSPAELVALAAEQRSRAPQQVDVPDPFGRSPRVHRKVATLIDTATAQIAGRFVALFG